MTLVERLRAAAPGTMLSMQVNDLAALREAADEIDLLRAVLTQIGSVANHGVNHPAEALARVYDLVRIHQQYGGQK